MTRDATTTIIVVLIATASTAIAQDGDSSSSSSYFICPQVPNLHCHNNSTTCLPGHASIDARHSHLNLPTHKDGYHCVCQEGYIGHECRIQVDNCNDDDPTTLSCYHGSKCRSTHNINNNEGGGYYCDCLQLNNISGEPAAKKYAGLMCQHEATSLCAAALVGTSTSSISSPGYYQPSGDQFCTNHGKCVKLVTSYDSHPGCLCRFGWSGDHCEVWQGEGDNPWAALQKDNENSGNVVAGEILFGMLIVALSAVAVGTIVLLIEARQRRRNACTSGDSAGTELNVVSGKSPSITSDCMQSPKEEEKDGVTRKEGKEVNAHAGEDFDDSSNPEIV